MDRGYQYDYKAYFGGTYRPAGEGSSSVPTSGSSAGKASGSGVSSGGVYSDEWWFWSEAGRGIWVTCSAKGKDSSFWRENKCDTRSTPAKGSKWWWWTTAGLKVWKDCEANGEKSQFWWQNDCGTARYVRDELDEHTMP